MELSPDKKGSKKRAATNELPVKFNGTIEDMIAISTTGQELRRKPKLKMSKE